MSQPELGTVTPEQDPLVYRCYQCPSIFVYPLKKEGMQFIYSLEKGL